jgi:hypothetical protein
VKKYCSVCTTRWFSHESSSIVALCRHTGDSGGPSYICCDLGGNDFAIPVPSHREVSAARPVPGMIGSCSGRALASVADEVTKFAAILIWVSRPMSTRAQRSRKGHRIGKHSLRNACDSLMCCGGARLPRSDRIVRIPYKYSRTSPEKHTASIQIEQ